MKTKILSIVFLIFTISTISAQKFEGKVTYDIGYELPEAMEAQRAMLPTEMIVYIGKKNTRMEQKTMMGDQIVITDMENKNSVLLMNMMGQKIAISMNADEGEEIPKPSIEYVDGEKEISGYACKKAIIKTTGEDGEEEEMEVFFTEEIPASANDKLPGLKGYPLEYSMNAQGMLMTLSAKDVSKEKVSKKLFETPEGYQSMTMEEFMQSMGGGQ